MIRRQESGLIDMTHKLNIPDSSDWKKGTDNPNVGIFWYDPEEDELFGVYSTLASDMNFFHSDIFNAEVRTCRPLHYALWQKGCDKGEDKRFQPAVPFFKYPSGRIFEVKDKGFVVCTGSWVKQFPQVRQMIIDEFHLPDNTEFLI